MSTPMGEGREPGEEQRMLDVLEWIASGIDGIAVEMKQLSSTMVKIAVEVG